MTAEDATYHIHYFLILNKYIYDSMHKLHLKKKKLCSDFLSTSTKKNIHISGHNDVSNDIIPSNVL